MHFINDHLELYLNKKLEQVKPSVNMFMFFIVVRPPNWLPNGYNKKCNIRKNQKNFNRDQNFYS